MVLFKVYSIKCHSGDILYPPLLTTGQLHWNICGLSSASAAVYAGPKGQKQESSVQSSLSAAERKFSEGQCVTSRNL